MTQRTKLVFFTGAADQKSKTFKRLSLTLDPSPAGRGRQLRRGCSGWVTLEQTPAHELTDDDGRFRLSQRERAGVRIPLNLSRLEPLNPALKDRRMKSGAEAARTPDARARSWRSNAARRVWSAGVLSAALGGRIMERENSPITQLDSNQFAEGI